MVPHPEANAFVASETEGRAGALSALPDGVNGADLYGISAESIAALHYSLFGQEYEADGIDLNVLGTHDLVHVYNQMHGGWLFRFPDDVVKTLARLKKSDHGRVARRWSRIFQNDGAPPTLDEVDRMLRQLVTLARGARQQGKPMFWLAPGC